MSLFATTESSIGNLKSAVGSAAYFVITGKPVGQSRESPRRLWFCRKIPDNGAIDPTFLLSAYILEMDRKPENVRIVPAYSPSEQWKTAFSGIAQLGGEQQVFLHLEKQVNAAPEGEFVEVIEVKLAPAQADPAIKNPPDKVIDNLFEPLGPTTTGKIGGYGTNTIPRLYMMAAVVMEKQFGASVLALITNRNGAIVALDCKKPDEGGCGHAEVKTLFQLKGQLPDGGAVFSTLKPCTMCAGLLNALDPKGNLRKYWVRDDPSYGADWYKGLGLNSLPNAQPLDKKCNNAKYLKLPGGESFLENFSFVRERKEGTEDEKKQWFQQWLGSLKLPQNVYFIAGGKLLKGSAPQTKQDIRTSKEGITTLNELFKKLGRSSESQKELQGRQYLGLTSEDQNSIKSNLTTYIKTKNEAVYPARIINFIPGNPASVSLRNAAHEALVAKLKKYGQWPPEWGEGPAFDWAAFECGLNPKVENVLVYLRSFLAAAGVNL